MEDFEKQYLESLLLEEKEELSKHAGQINQFRNFMQQKGLVLTDEHFRFQQTVGIMAVYPGIIHHLNPCLTPDKEGLFRFEALCENFERRRFNHGYLYGPNFMLMAHPYFRRGMHEINNYAPRFVEFFWNHNIKGIDNFISLDSDRVRINVDDSSYRELDTWYGPAFNRDISEITDGIVKLRPPIDLSPHHISFLFGDVYSLDIKWATKGKIKSFQAEEFKTDKIRIIKDGKQYFPVRYVHAEFNLDNQCFRHFDGAIHFYTEQEYMARRDSDFNYNSKNSGQIKTLSQKLFKMNGVVPLDTWIEFTSHFLTGNPLVFEYFEGQYPDRISEVVELIRLRVLH